MLGCHNSFLSDSLQVMTEFCRGFLQLLQVHAVTSQLEQLSNETTANASEEVRSQRASCPDMRNRVWACVRISWPICAPVSLEPSRDRRKMAELRNFYIQMQQMIWPSFAAVEGPGDR